MAVTEIEGMNRPELTVISKTYEMGGSGYITVQAFEKYKQETMDIPVPSHKLLDEIEVGQQVKIMI